MIIGIKIGIVLGFLLWYIRKNGTYLNKSYWYLYESSTGILQKLLGCNICISFWASLPFAIEYKNILLVVIIPVASAFSYKTLNED